MQVKILIPEIKNKQYVGHFWITFSPAKLNLADGPLKMSLGKRLLENVFYTLVHLITYTRMTIVYNKLTLDDPLDDMTL